MPNRSIFLILTTIIIYSNLATANTLIVTHPSREYDPFRMTGPAISKLLGDPQFKRKIVLMEGISKNFIFDKRGLQFETQFSERGEIRPSWKIDDTEFTVAGGNFYFCLDLTVSQLIRAAKGDIKITFATGAIFQNMRFMELLGPDKSDKSISIASIERSFGREVYENIIQDYVKILFEQLEKRCEGYLVHRPKIVYDRQIATVVETIGNKKVTLIFDGNEYSFSQ